MQPKRLYLFIYYLTNIIALVFKPNFRHTFKYGIIIYIYIKVKTQTSGVYIQPLTRETNPNYKGWVEYKKISSLSWFGLDLDSKFKLLGQPTQPENLKKK